MKEREGFLCVQYMHRYYCNNLFILFYFLQ